MISAFIEQNSIQFDPGAVIRRLDLGLGFLLVSAGDMHGAFRVPAPEIDELAAKLERLKAKRAEPQPDPPPKGEASRPREQ